MTEAMALSFDLTAFLLACTVFTLLLWVVLRFDREDPSDDDSFLDGGITSPPFPPSGSLSSPNIPGMSESRNQEGFEPIFRGILIEEDSSEEEQPALPHAKSAFYNPNG